tara:strand:+ start:189 stop:584 length:396 start_codon:yes stop_codon:yes gene_type:complete
MGNSGPYVIKYDTEAPVPFDLIPRFSCISYDPAKYRKALKKLSGFNDKGEEGYFFRKPKPNKPWQLIGKISWAVVEDTGNVKLYFENLDEPKNLRTKKSDSLSMLGYKKVEGKGSIGAINHGVFRITTTEN